MGKKILRLSILVCSVLVAFQAKPGDLNITNLLSVVANRRSTSSAFQAAFEALDSVNTDQYFWLQRAADELLEPNRRRKCVKHIFEHMDRQNLTMGKLLQSLEAPVKWISPDKIGMVPFATSGNFPEKFYSSRIRRIIFIPILKDMRGDYRLGFYVGLGEDVDERELRQAFATGNAADRIKNIEIIHFEKYDTDDVEAKYPGEAWRGITW